MDEWCETEDRLFMSGTERERLGLDDSVTVLQRNGLQWHGHVLRKDAKQPAE